MNLLVLRSSRVIKFSKNVAPLALDEWGRKPLYSMIPKYHRDNDYSS